MASHSKGAAKREEILSGLMARLASGELRNPALRVIGRALGIEPAHIIYYFGTREALLQAVITRWDHDSVMGTTQSPDRPQMTLDGYAANIRRNLAIPGIVHLYLTFAAEAVEPTHPAHEFFKRRFDFVRMGLVEAIQGEQAKGTISPTMNPNLEARLLIALADGLQLQSLVDPQINAPDDLEAVIAKLRTV